MEIELMYHSPLWVCAKAIRKCWASEDKSDTVFHQDLGFPAILLDNGEYFPCEAGYKDKELIERVGNKNKHASTLEHLVYTFDIDGTSRSLLQEHARHRIASISVQSSRYTIEKVLDGLGTIEECLVMTGDKDIDELNISHMTKLSKLIEQRGKTLPRDISKYALVEAYKTSFVWTVNARSLQNFLQLRTNKAALWEIRQLSYELYNILPEEHKYLFFDSLYQDTKTKGK